MILALPVVDAFALLIDDLVSADVQVCTVLALLTDNVGDDEGETRFHPFLRLLRKLFDVDHSEHVALHLLRLLVEGVVDAKHMIGDKLSEFQGGRDILVVRPNVVWKLPSLLLFKLPLLLAALALFDVLVPIPVPIVKLLFLLVGIVVVTDVLVSVLLVVRSFVHQV